MFDVIPYMDPKSFNNRYDSDNKSDVYSFGVIMWQLSSGNRPFYAEGIKYDISLSLAIQGGKREKIINGTPIEYSNIYTSELLIIFIEIFFLKKTILINYLIIYL